MTTAIIGSGFAGVAAAHGLHLAGKPAVIFEAKRHWGGHTHAHISDGFTFDEGPHLSFTPDERVQRIFAKGAGGIEELPARITNYYEGHWVTHPAQVHLHGLDADLITNVITDFVDAQQNPPEILTYADWLIAMYGRTFAENFPFRYTRKYWTVEPSAMGIDWVGKRMYPPKLEEMLKGALVPENTGDFHYLKKYRYPSSGGYQSFMRGLAENAKFELAKEVIAVDVSSKRLEFADGTDADYSSLISTMPLDLLVQRIKGREVPAEVLEATSKLLCTSVVLVDIGVDRDDLFGHEWFYVYDEDISISRVHFPHMLAPSMAPVAKGSIQAEVYFSRERPLEEPLENVGKRVVDEFIQMGVLRSHDEVLFARPHVVEYANIVFDHHRAPALDVVKPFVNDCGIVLAGRYGEWDYHWTDDATRAGWNAAATVASIDVEELLEGI